MTKSRAILATLAYHDIFNFPLKLSELANYLISVKADQAQINTHIKRLLGDSKIGESHEFYFLANRSKILKNRKLRQRYATSKFKKARFYAQILKLISQIKLVAISGALAMGNSTRLDDIDLVIICAKNQLWTTRFLANMILFPYRRYPNSKSISDRACLNIFLDESALKIRPSNLYMAHEICQMKPLWDRDRTYRRFINANRWVYKFLPNWQLESSQLSVDSSQKDKPSTVNRKPSTVENFLRNFQLWYMRSRITTERIGEHQLFFHPQNTQTWVLGEYQKRLKRLRLSTLA